MTKTVSQAKKALAKQIRKRRLALGISQEAFAAKAGIDRTYASKIERGIGNPSLEVLCMLAETLKCQLQDLFQDG